MPLQEGGSSGSGGPPAGVPVQGGEAVQGGDRGAAQDEPPGVEVELREGEQEEEVPVVVAKAPECPTAEEIARHEVSHIPYRAWCRSCVLGRGRSAAHKKMIAEKKHALPTIMHDYGFIGKDDQQAMPMLVSKSSRTLWIDAEIVPSKGDENEYSIEVMKSAIKRMGHSKFVHKSDQERALKNLNLTVIEALGGSVEAVQEESPAGSSQANGAMETT